MISNKDLAINGAGRKLAFLNWLCIQLFLTTAAIGDARYFQVDEPFLWIGTALDLPAAPLTGRIEVDFMFEETMRLDFLVAEKFRFADKADEDMVEKMCE